MTSIDFLDYSFQLQFVLESITKAYCTKGKILM